MNKTQKHPTYGTGFDAMKHKPGHEVFTTWFAMNNRASR